MQKEVADVEMTLVPEGLWCREGHHWKREDVARAEKTSLAQRLLRGSEGSLHSRPSNIHRMFRRFQIKLQYGNTS